MSIHQPCPSTPLIEIHPCPDGPRQGSLSIRCHREPESVIMHIGLLESPLKAAQLHRSIE